MCVPVREEAEKSWGWLAPDGVRRPAKETRHVVAIDRDKAVTNAPGVGVLIGRSRLLVHCATRLQEQGWAITRILTDDPAVVEWGESTSIEIRPLTNHEIAALTDLEFDDLFSVANPAVIPGAVLSTPRRSAINYHDGPLPRYAGVHATSWAIMNGEKTHGICWHHMAERVDAGDILASRALDIAARETAFTLNARCFEAAIDAFDDVLATLLGTSETFAEQQDLSARTYFGRTYEPSPGCYLDWNASAEELDAIVRALQFGPYPNPIGVAKIFTNAGRTLLVDATEPLNRNSTVAPGTVVSRVADTVVVATTTRDLMLKRVRPIDGGSIETAIPADHSVQMSTPSESLRDELRQARRACVDAETYFLAQVDQASPFAVPFVPEGTSQSARARVDVTPPAGTHGSLDNMSVPATLLATTLVYFSRIGETDVVSVGLRSPAPVPRSDALSSVFPLTLTMASGATVRAVCDDVNTTLSEWRNHAVHARDLLWRRPELTSRSAALDPTNWPVQIIFTDTDTLPSNNSTHTSPLVIEISAQGMTLDADSKLVGEETCRRIAAHVTELMSAVVANPSLPVQEAPILPDAERDALIHGFQGFTLGSKPDELPRLHALIEAQAEIRPEQVAIIDGDSELTYGELNTRANRCAHDIRATGVRPGDIVGVLGHTSSGVVVGMLATLKAGAAYLPLNPDHPRARLERLVEEAGVTLVLATAAHRDVLKTGRTLIDLDADPISRDTTPLDDTTTKPSDLAYVIYTSGSTGRPKGVMIEHQSIVHNLTWMQETWQLGPDDRTLQHIPLDFDAALHDLIWPLTAGATVVATPKSVSRDVAAIVDMIKRREITHIHFVPAMLQAVLDQPSISDRASSLRLVFCGGENLSADLQRRFLDMLSAQLVHIYGPTEASVSVTCWACKRDDPREFVPIGRPMPGSLIYLLDDKNSPVPIGLPGEMCLGGVPLARGYLNQPDETDARFVANPFGDESMNGLGRLYRSGDTARFLSDGTLQFVGRIDDKVKVHGCRVELGEIERQLITHGDVVNAAVRAWSDGATDNRLVAYVVPRTQPPPDTTELREYLRRRLPDFMIPAEFIAMTSLPLTANGKVDRTALPEVDETSRPGQRRDSVLPRTDMERQLRDVWEEVLAIDGIGVQESFFDLGGHSLLALRLVGRIEEELGTRVSSSVLFRAPTIERLARVLASTSEPEDGTASLVEIQPHGSRPPLFCVHPAEGSVVDFAELANRLGDEQPFYALEAQGLDGSGRVLETVEEMARYYVSLVRSLQPTGPYFLAGRCFGGVVAYEMAQQLSRAGEKVALLALLDSLRVPKPDAMNQSEGFRKHLMIELGADASPIKRRTRPLRRRGRRIIRKITNLWRPAPTEAEQRVHRVRDANINALRKYQPERYPGRISLFYTQDFSWIPEYMLRQVPWTPEEWQRRLADDWASMSEEGLDLFLVPGTHQSMLNEPHVAMLADEIRKCIAAHVSI